eukprot:CAMPEP_0113537368 /NCGR_PEP_ID=MMETSP0015_2-20120614/6788_1 /TAXON_ID=2838 /ORGANISM="Odontella" /LENGTH=516 /DNA_ID=CAMNT_0000436857 /DNA_START=145 /DNA_END=1695 /DNA_ORIENTATION=+ /assembly_acc=CAM_ASM_000160
MDFNGGCESGYDDSGEDDSLCSYEYESVCDEDDISFYSEPEAKEATPGDRSDVKLPENLRRTKCDTDDSIDLKGHASFACANLRQAEKLMHRTVQETTSLLCLHPASAHILLRYFKWDQDVLNDKYFGQEEVVWRACGISCEHITRPTNSLLTKKDGTDSTGALCGICFESKPGEMRTMQCGHEYCHICWKRYLETAINTEGPRCLYTTCPEPRCDMLVTERTIAELAPTVLNKFTQYQLRSFIETNKKLRWCPGPSCEQIAVAGSEGFEGEMACKCGTSFCLVCGEASHKPLTCQRLAQWTKKCMDESENANWILAHTKECPKCQVRIEKNQGCNHMTCRNCNYEFCWLCMSDWRTGHGYDSSCNKFDLKEVEKGQSAISEAQAELERYLHCYNRFHSHSVGQAFSEDQLRAFLSKKTEEENMSVEKPEVRVFQNALCQLIECRRVLKYSYAAVFFMEDGHSSKILFEDQQKLLESFTESLSELTESKRRQEKEMMNMTGVVAHFVKNVLSGGYY